jgi:hypothetical protein
MGAVFVAVPVAVAPAPDISESPLTRYSAGDRR